MKTMRILILMTLGIAPLSQAMWSHFGRSFASRFATSRVKPLFSTFKQSLSKNKGKLAACGLLSGLVSSYAYQHRIEQEHPFPKHNSTITIKELAGNIKVEGWDQDRLLIGITKSSHTQEAANDVETSVNVTENNADIKSTYRKKYTTDNQPSIVTIGSETRFNGHLTPVVSYDIKAPRCSSLVVKNVVGAIVLKEMWGGIDAETQVGDITMEDCGDIINNTKTKTKSITGNIEAKRALKSLDARTTSGNITISGNTGWPGEVNAKSTSGNVTVTDYDVAYATSVSGNATVTGAKKGKASSVSGKASFNGNTGSSIWWE